ncbi:MAG: hypothetical protein H6R24_1986 [Proteobacteria bacterium]|jgi:hypothetical protein|nr:hypothetical protein [Pseudomonadota bacterium]
MSGQGGAEGLGALVYHGMVRGLALLLTRPVVAPALAAARAMERGPVPPDPRFVRLLANLLLQTEAEGRHVD